MKVWAFGASDYDGVVIQLFSGGGETSPTPSGVVISRKDAISLMDEIQKALDSHKPGW